MRIIKKLLLLVALFFAAVTLVSQNSFARVPAGVINISTGS
jgi:hypothetical protein